MDSLQQIDSAIQNLTNTVNSYGFNMRHSTTSAYQEVIDSLDNKERELDQVKMSLESYNEIIKNGPMPGENNSDTSGRHLINFLERYNLKVSNKVFKEIKDNSIVEINTLGHKQIFRTTNFFSLTSYDIATLTFAPWSELFSRPAGIFETIFGSINTVTSEEIEITTPSIPRHILSETETGLKFVYEMEKLACVFDEFTNQAIGYLTIISVDKRASGLHLVH